MPEINQQPSDKKVALYIEDDGSNRTLLKKLLQLSNFDVLEAADGITGLEIATKNHVDIIILDINMIGLNGYEIATLLKSHDKTKNIPLVAFTANMVQNSRAKAIISGCDGFIHKPIDIATFIKKIGEYLAGKKESIEPEKIHKLTKEYNVDLVKHLEKEIRELKRLNDDLKKIDKIKTDFMTLVSHELRTPLVTILGYTEMLSSCKIGQLNLMQSKMVGIVSRNAARLEKIVKAFLTMSELENGTQKLEIEKVNVVKELENLVEDYEITLKNRSLNCNLFTTGNIPLIDCDTENILQVFTGLLSNAIKYTRDGSEISITVNYPSQKISVVSDLDKNKYIDVIFDDEGIGIPADKLERVFDKFTELGEINNHHSSETEFMGSGVGLGLSICKAIINTLNGFIWAENRRPEGTRMIIVLPITQHDTILYSKIVE